MIQHIENSSSPKEVFLDSCEWIDDLVKEMRSMSSNRYEPIDRANRLDRDAKFAFHARGFAYQLMGISLHLLIHGDKPLGFQFQNLETFFSFVKRAMDSEDYEEKMEKLTKRNIYWLSRGFTPPIPEASLISRPGKQQPGRGNGDVGLTMDYTCFHGRGSNFSSDDDSDDDSDKTVPMSPWTQEELLEQKKKIEDMKIVDFRQKEDDDNENDENTVPSMDF
jgi:hypothetical protein